MFYFSLANQNLPALPAGDKLLPLWTRFNDSSVRFYTGGGVMKLAMVIYSNEPETVWNAFRLGVQALGQGDQVGIFLLGRGVEAEGLDEPRFPVVAVMKDFARARWGDTCLWHLSQTVAAGRFGAVPCVDFSPSVCAPSISLMPMHAG